MWTILCTILYRICGFLFKCVGAVANSIMLEIENRKLVTSIRVQPDWNLIVHVWFPLEQEPENNKLRQLEKPQTHELMQIVWHFWFCVLLFSKYVQYLAKTGTFFTVCLLWKQISAISDTKPISNDLFDEHVANQKFINNYYNFFDDAHFVKENFTRIVHCSKFLCRNYSICSTVSIFQTFSVQWRQKNVFNFNQQI